MNEENVQDDTSDDTLLEPFHLIGESLPEKSFYVVEAKEPPYNPVWYLHYRDAHLSYKDAVEMMEKYQKSYPDMEFRIVYLTVTGHVVRLK